MNAWPALRQVVHDGWVLRFSGSYTGRANSVHPLYPGNLPLGEKIAHCEQAYHRLGLVPLFKLTTAAQPDGLDGALAALNYRAFNRTSVQTVELGKLPPLPAADETVVAYESPRESWVESVVRFRSINPHDAKTLRAILAALVPPARFATVVEGGETVACGLAVLERPWVGLFDIVTREDRRRRGHGGRVTRALLDWAKGEGAERAYLQVTLDNTPASRLYATLGFRETYQYWYRAGRRP